MKIVVNPEYQHLKGFIERVPAIFEQEGEVIYAERNTLKTFEAEGLSVCIKSFHRPFIINRLVYGFLRPSKAERSYSYGLELLKRGISTPAPIAYIEDKRAGLLFDSYYISINQTTTGMMRELRQGPLAGREQLLKSFARFAAHIHTQGVLHKDFSPGNILYLQEGSDYHFYLVDINRMKFQSVDLEQGCENLKRLWGSDEMIRFIAREYAVARGFDPDKCETLSLQYHTAFWKKYARRHNGFRPYLTD